MLRGARGGNLKPDKKGLDAVSPGSASDDEWRRGGVLVDIALKALMKFLYAARVGYEEVPGL